MPQSRFLRKKGIRNTRQATRKKTLPNIAQKLPMLEMTKPIAEMMNRIQPIRLMVLLEMRLTRGTERGKENRDRVGGRDVEIAVPSTGLTAYCSLTGICVGPRNPKPRQITSSRSGMVMSGNLSNSIGSITCATARRATCVP